MLKPPRAISWLAQVLLTTKLRPIVALACQCPLGEHTRLPHITQRCVSSLGDSIQERHKCTAPWRMAARCLMSPVACPACAQPVSVNCTVSNLVCTHYSCLLLHYRLGICVDLFVKNQSASFPMRHSTAVVKLRHCASNLEISL